MSLPEVLTHQRRACARIGSEMYAEIIDVVAADLAADGPCARLLRPHEDDPFGSALVLRFLGAVHWLVLADRAPGLAQHYPTAGGTPGPTLAADFLAAVEGLSDEVAARLPLPVQTNEVGRCAALVGGYVEAARRAGD